MKWSALIKRLAPRNPREKRLVLYLLIVAGFAAWKLLPRPWTASFVVQTAHYQIESSATHEQTEQLSQQLEILYSAYTNKFGTLQSLKREHPRLKVRFHKDREEFRRIYPGLGWAEAFYKKPYARAYFAAGEINPWHWIIHEAVHQLNEEVAGLSLEKWFEEGLAEYFSASRIKDGELQLGTIDKEAYPVWWIDEIAKGETLSASRENKSVISLRSIITGWGGPRMTSHVNLYYLHWWTLTHHLFENVLAGAEAAEFLRAGGDLKTVEEMAGPLLELEQKWHGHVRHIRGLVNGNDLEFHRSGRLPQISYSTNAAAAKPR